MKARQKLLAAGVALALPLMVSAQTPPAEQPPAEPAPAPTTPPPAKPAEPKAEPAKAPVVQVYGTLNVNLQYTQASESTAAGANVKPRMAVSIDSSNIGVRGTLDLIQGIKGTYQCETQASIDGEDLRSLCNRNSRVGLTGGWGTIFYGNWDTPFKAMAYGTKADDVFLNTDAYGFNAIMGSPGYGTRSSAWITSYVAAPADTTATANTTTDASRTASFDHRAANSVAYWTPKFSGLSAKFQWGTDEFRSQRGLVDPLLLSGVVNYDMGPLSVAGSVEYHEDVYGLRVINAGNPSLSASKDWAWRVAAGYDIPLGGDSLVNVNGMVDQLIYKQDDAFTGFKEYKRFAWQVGAKLRTGAHEFRVRYSQALNPDITAAPGAAAPDEKDLGATDYAVGYAYYLSKGAQIYLSYTEIDNGKRARYTFPVSGAAAVVAANTPAGSKLSAGGLGIRLAF